MNSKKYCSLRNENLNIQYKHEILIGDKELIVNINYTVPEIVYVNQIIKKILILLKGAKIIKCSKF